jgi:hypothetical protein
MGIVVLPENHALRGILPDLESALRDGVRSAVAEFMSKTFFEIDRYDHDELFNKLISRRELLLAIVSEKDGSVFKDFLNEWYAAGMPKPCRVHHEAMPFSLLPAGEGELLSKEYYSKKNIRSLGAMSLYKYIASHGFPLVGKFVLPGTTDKAEANDLVDYIEFKIGRLAKDGN